MRAMMEMCEKGGNVTAISDVIQDYYNELGDEVALSGRQGLGRGILSAHGTKYILNMFLVYA